MTIPPEPPPAVDDEADAQPQHDGAPDPHGTPRPGADQPDADHQAGAHEQPGAPRPGADQPGAQQHAPFAGTSRPATASATADRFFLWVSGLGIARSEGWLGGVAAGLAARLRIDPLIVRGVLVVAALFGLPVIFLYALAWALLPDLDGRIHVRDLFRGDYQPVQWGILAMAVIGLVPTAPLTGTVFGLGYVSWSALSIFSWIVGLAIVGVLIFLIVRAASRTPGASAPDLPTASADPAAPAAPVTLGDSGSPEGAGAPSPLTPPAPFLAGVPGTGFPADARPEPPAAPGSGDPEALAAWKQQHAAWKEQDQAWRRQQQDAERAVRDQLRRERQAEGAAFAAVAAEQRRVRRASNPRASFAYVAAAMGLALVVGAAVGLWSGLGAASAPVGLLAAALVLALAMIVAGAWRRRSGFLAFLTTTTLIIGLITGAATSMQQVVFGWASITNNATTSITQPWGELNVELAPHDDGRRTITIDKGTGQTWIYVQPGVELDLSAVLGTSSVAWYRTDEESGDIIDSGFWDAERQGDQLVTEQRISAENGSVSTVQPVDITQLAGNISVYIIEPTEDER